MTCVCPNCGTSLPNFRELKPQRIELRTYLLPVLFELCRAGRGLTLDEIAVLSDDPTRIRRHFAQLRHFNLIRKDAGRYYPTELAKNAVNGHARLPTFVYTLNGEPVNVPEGAEEPAYMFVWEIEPNSFREPVISAESQLIQVSFFEAI